MYKPAVYYSRSVMLAVIRDILIIYTPTVYGYGLNVHYWLYVEYNCSAIDLVTNNGKIGEACNIGGNNQIRSIDIVRLICKKLNKSENLITYVEDRKGHDLRYGIDATKISKDLGWTPKTKFEDGIDKTIKWYVDNKNWWR